MDSLVKRLILFAGIVHLNGIQLLAKNGLSEKPPTTVKVHTHFSQYEDFHEGLARKLNVTSNCYVVIAEKIQSTKASFKANTQAMEFGLHAYRAPINLIFLEEVSTFPETYRRDTFISLHGSWNGQQPEDYKTIGVHLENERPLYIENFLSGFLHKKGILQFGRSVRLMAGKKGVCMSGEENKAVYFIFSSKN